MTSDIRKQLLKEFPSKMENRQAFIMQFIVQIAQKGEKPPSREIIENSIDQMITDGTFEVKDDLLILKEEKSGVIDLKDDIVPELNEPVISLDNLDEFETLVMSGFQGKFENRMAVIMNATMKVVYSGNSPPDRKELESAILRLISKGVLKESNNMLIKL